MSLRLVFGRQEEMFIVLDVRPTTTVEAVDATAAGGQRAWRGAVAWHGSCARNLATPIRQQRLTNAFELLTRNIDARNAHTPGIKRQITSEPRECKNEKTSDIFQESGIQLRQGNISRESQKISKAIHSISY